MNAQNVINHASKSVNRQAKLFATFYPMLASQKLADKNLTKILGGKYGN